MKENFHQVVGFIITGVKYPSFALPYFLDSDGNYCVQDFKKDCTIEKKILPHSELLMCKGIHYFNGIHYMEKTFYSKKISAFAFSPKTFCIGTSSEILDYLSEDNLSIKQKRLLQKNNLLGEILDFNIKTKKEEYIINQKEKKLKLNNDELNH